ncbi:hypothetical protein VTO73DRAFT_348 [Trametes versicolor]
MLCTSPAGSRCVTAGAVPCPCDSPFGPLARQRTVATRSRLHYSDHALSFSKELWVPETEQELTKRSVYNTETGATIWQLSPMRGQ